MAAMFKCFFCGAENNKSGVKFCTECGFSDPTVNWLPEEIDQPNSIQIYFNSLKELYFDSTSEEEVDQISKSMRVNWKISNVIHLKILNELRKEKSDIEHFSKFKFEFNENVKEAFAGNDTYLSFRYSNFSSENLFKISLYWTPPVGTDGSEFRADIKTFVRPGTSAVLGGMVVFERIGIKEIADLRIQISDQFQKKAVFRASPFTFKVGNANQTVNNITSTTNQISIEARVMSADGMFNPSGSTGTKKDNEEAPNWRELDFKYLIENSSNDNAFNQWVDNNDVDINKFSDQEFDPSDLSGLQKGVEQGNAVAQYLLGNAYLEGKYIHQSFERAVELLESAALQGYSIAQNALGELLLNGLGVSKNESLAFEWFSKSANQGFALGLFNLAFCYKDGAGVKQDVLKAILHLESVSGEQFARAQDTLGEIYLRGQGVIRSVVKALGYFQAAADKNHSNAWFQLGLIYQNGDGIPPDYERAFMCYQKAADLHNPNSLNSIGYCYDYGVGVEVDPIKAVSQYELAASMGSDEAQFNLGLKYFHGMTFDVSKQKAFELFTQAANQNNIEAQSYLAYMSRTGDSIPVDLVKAKFWYEKAATQGHIESQFQLGLIYQFGLGAEKNKKLAGEWFQLASAQGHQLATSSLSNLVVIQDLNLMEEMSKIQSPGYLSDKVSLFVSVLADFASFSSGLHSTIYLSSEISQEIIEKILGCIPIDQTEVHGLAIESLVSKENFNEHGALAFIDGNFTVFTTRGIHTGMVSVGEYSVGEVTAWSFDGSIELWRYMGNLGEHYLGSVSANTYFWGCNFVFNEFNEEDLISRYLLAKFALSVVINTYCNSGDYLYSNSILEYDNGMRFIGVTREDTHPDGVGVLHYPDGNVMSGEISADSVFQGVGLLASNDHSLTFADWSNGQTNGLSIFKWSGDFKGHKYVGEASKGNRHGFGVYTFPDGLEQRGMFNDNNYIPSTSS